MASDVNSADMNSFVYAIVNNIPSDYHSKDIRNYFSQFIEGRGFDCFHFRHRPESQVAKNCGESPPHSNSQLGDRTSQESLETPESFSNTKRKGTTCCVVRLKPENLAKLIRMYHRKHWLDRKGDSIPSFCHITKIKIANAATDKDQCYKTRGELRLTPTDSRDFTVSDLQGLPELRPPDIMPNGNVGTPTTDFLEFIKDCRLPPSVIKKLGLSFPKTRTNRKYGSVPFDYHNYVGDCAEEEEEEWMVLSGEGHELQRVEESISERSRVEDSISAASQAVQAPTRRELKKLQKKERKKTKQLMRENIEEKMIGRNDDSNEDNDSCEEWERHEALTDDPTNQERNNERLFEEEIELKWEKGGSGLVFYTDAQYWKEQEGDFDEQTADDLNVDMSGYYEDGAGDLDARDYLTLRQESRRRRGDEDTDRFSAGIGRFEKHTKGIGRKVLESQGWQEGQGLGSTITGRADALDNEGQHPRDKKGFG